MKLSGNIKANEDILKNMKTNGSGSEKEIAQENQALKSINEQLQDEIERQEGSIEQQRKIITEMRSELDGYKVSIKSCEETEKSLKSVIFQQQRELKEQEDTSQEEGNPDYDLLELRR